MDDSDATAGSRRSVLAVVPPARPRKLAKVPFVELADDMTEADELCDRVAIIARGELVAALRRIVDAA